MPLPVMLPSFWVVSTKPGAALGRVKGSLQPLQGRGWFLAPRDRGPEAGVDCWRGHQFVTYGSSAISRARLIATETWLWWRRHVPVIRRERILPFSET